MIVRIFCSPASGGYYAGTLIRHANERIFQNEKQNPCQKHSKTSKTRLILIAGCAKILQTLPSICQFLSHASVHDFRKLVKKLVSHATEATVYKGETPGDVLLYKNLFCSLIKTANTLMHKKCSPITITEEELLNKKNFCSHYVGANAWKEFPRHLSKKEYCNPYLAFQHFFNYQSLTDWVQCWEQVVEGALCGDTSFAPAAPLRVYDHLARLVEAAHLVDVREIIHAEGAYRTAADKNR